MFWQVFLITRQLDGSILQLHGAFRRLPVKALTLSLIYFATAWCISAAEMRKAALELAVWGIFCNFAAHRVAYSPNAPCRAHGYGWGNLREKATD
ncbi:MAG: hypothetical protein MJZ43_04150 [Bacteroidaceae bacterium]|nr:hypothetical protein [Bacteroidaceae bacterium]